MNGLKKETRHTIYKEVPCSPEEYHAQLVKSYDYRTKKIKEEQERHRKRLLKLQAEAKEALDRAEKFKKDYIGESVIMVRRSKHVD